jgi:RND family efflux transporter MFP subunit
MRITRLAIMMGLALVAFNGCKGKQGEQENSNNIKYVKVETVENEVSQNQLIFNGKIKEKSLTTLSFRVGGPLAKLNVKTGDFVKAGQVIAAIDQRDYELQVQTTKAQFQQVESEYQRYKQLVELDKIPENTYEKIQSGYLMAKAAYENAQNQLRDTELKAPFPGYIHEKMVENFQTVGPGAPIVSLIDISHLEVVASVPENQLQRVRNDKASYLNVKNAQVSDLPVDLLSVGEKAMKDGLYEVKFSLKNTGDLMIAPGMTAEVSMICDARDHSTVIASTAIFHEKTDDYVWVFNSITQKVEKREVEIALADEQGKAQVISGLQEGEQVITAGVHYLVEGETVKPIEKPAVTNVGGLL